MVSLQVCGVILHQINSSKKKAIVTFIGTLYKIISQSCGLNTKTLRVCFTGQYYSSLSTSKFHV